MTIFNDDLSNLLHSETFWVAIAFLIFIILSYKKAKEVLIESLDKRIEGIKKKINDAEELRKEAENNLNEAKINLKKMTSDKKRIINEANEEAKNLEKKLLNEEKTYSEGFKKRVDDRIEQSKNEAILDIKKVALEISIKSILELYEKEKFMYESDSIAKSVTKLFNEKNKEKKNYKEL